jgi:hypothetical protein
MNNSHDDVDTTVAADSSLAEHSRTHRRWTRTVLAVYAALVVVGLLATLAHQAFIADPDRAEVLLAARKAAH